MAGQRGSRGCLIWNTHLKHTWGRVLNMKRSWAARWAGCIWYCNVHNSGDGQERTHQRVKQPKQRNVMERSELRRQKANGGPKKYPGKEDKQWRGWGVHWTSWVEGTSGKCGRGIRQTPEKFEGEGWLGLEIRVSLVWKYWVCEAKWDYPRKMGERRYPRGEFWNSSIHRG